VVDVSAKDVAVEPINSPETNRADAIILFELIVTLLQNLGVVALRRMISVDLV
jgi:hypothetical protein